VRTARSGQTLVAAGGLLSFVMLGWTALLVPSLIRQIEAGFAITDANMGVVFFIGAVTFTSGSLFAGWAIARFGRRIVLIGGVGLLVVGCAAVLIPAFPVFLAASVIRGFGSGITEVGIQGLFLAAFTGAAQARSINMVHFCFSVGAALTPVAVAAIIGAGVDWTVLLAASALPWLVVGVLITLAPMDGRSVRGPVAAVRLRPSVALAAAALAIAVYVAAEVGVSNWLVRFLQAADLGLAASALTLFWVGLSASRLLAARFGGSVAPETLAIGSFLVAAAAIAGAVLIPSLEISIALFGVVGFAFGPVYPAIILFGGRISDRRDAVTSILTSSSVGGAIFYPPLMGVISVGPGLGVAMGGTAVLSLAGAGLVAVAARSLGRAQARVAEQQAA